MARSLRLPLARRRRDPAMSDESTPGPTPERASPIARREAAYDRTVTPLIADALAAEAERMPFSIPGREVYQIILAGRDGRPQTLVTLWPWIGRVDLVIGAAAISLTGVALVRLESGGVVFVRRSGETLSLGRDGRVVARL
jgi:hypothetical protein